MRHALLMKTTFLVVLSLAIAAPVWAQWTTPTIDGSIGTGEYGTNNQLNNAGNTGQTWNMTWDASNLYVGIVNANVQEGLVLYVADPNNNANGNLTGFNYDGASFSSLPFRATFVTYAKHGYREYRNSNGGGGWGSSTSGYGQFADDNGGTREVAIPWSAITGGGIPSSFVFFGYLVSGGGYIYGQAPSDNNIGGFAGLNATATQYFAVIDTGNGTSTPPFSLEQPAGFSAADKAGFFHDTFDPFYRDQEGAVPESTPVTLRFRTLHSSGIWGVTARAYIFDTATGVTTGPVDTGMPFDQNITIGSTEYDIWKTTLTMPSSTSVYYYKFKINRDQTNGFYSDDYLDDNDNVHKDGTRRGQRRRTLPVVPVHGLRSRLPDAGMVAKRQRLSHSAGPLPQWRPDQRLLPYRIGNRLSDVLWYRSRNGHPLRHLEHADVRSAQQQLFLLQQFHPVL